jgi:hypothetical protein
MDAKATSQVEQVEQVEQGGQVEVEAVAELAGQADVAALDATLRETDWPVIQRLWRSGVSNESIYRLLRLRLRYRGSGRPAFGPHMDGFQPDARVQFARWMVQQGRFNEGL